MENGGWRLLQGYLSFQKSLPTRLNCSRACLASKNASHAFKAYSGGIIAMYSMENDGMFKPECIASRNFDVLAAKAIQT